MRIIIPQSCNSHLKCQILLPFPTDHFGSWGNMFEEREGLSQISQICNNLRQILMHRHNWGKQEDNNLIAVVGRFGCEDWTMNSQKLKQQCQIARMNNRSGKQCRQRWYNHLDPSIKKSGWTEEEQIKLFKAQKVHGNKWKEICSQLPGRTDNDVKNRFYSTLRRSLRRLNKYIGQKNSTSQMRQIKPSVLTSIIKFIYEKSTSEDHDLLGELRELPELIFRFSTFKPVKHNMNSKIDAELRQKINLILNLVEKFKKSCQGRKKQRTKKQLRAQPSLEQNQEVFVKTQEVIEYTPNQEEQEEKYHQEIEEGQSQYEHEQDIDDLFGASQQRKEFPRQLSPIITIRKRSSVPEGRRKNSHGLDRMKEEAEIKLEEEFDHFPIIQNPNDHNNMFEEGEDGLFVPFEQPSISFNENFQDLVVLGKHIDPIHFEYNPQDFCRLKQQEIDEVLQENYQ